jgi:hypothetical protein
MALLSRNGWFFSFSSPLNQPRFPARSYRIRRGLPGLAIICALVVSCSNGIPKPLCLSAVVCLGVINRLLVRVLAKQWRLVRLVSETLEVDAKGSSGHGRFRRVPIHPTTAPNTPRIWRGSRISRFPS